MSSESLAFKDWLKGEGLVHTGNVKQIFDDTIIGFEADDYLNSILTNITTREPLLPALGGLPFALQHHVDTDLKHFEAAGIKPYFIFNGLDTACRDRKSVLNESQKASKTLHDAWTVYDQGRGDDAVVAFGKACTYRTSNILRWLFHHLHKRGISVEVAPYNASAQLVYLDREGHLGACYGSASCLVFGADKVVTKFDWDNQQVSWVVLKEILGKLMMTHSQFVDLCLLSGSSILATMPELDTDADLPGSRMIAVRAVMNRANQEGILACIQAKDEDYLNLFRKAKTAVKHMVVHCTNGDIKPLDVEHAPGDTHEFIGTRPAEELTAYHTYGLLGSRLLNARMNQEILETQPLDGGSSKAYQDLVQDKLRPMRARSMTMLTTRLHRFFHKKDVNLTCWFNESNSRALGIDPGPDGVKDAESWHVREALVAQSAEAKGIDPNKSPIQYAIAVLSDDTLAKKTVTPKKEGEHSVLNKPSELLSNTVWRFLQDRGYINSNHTLSAWGKALKAAFDRASSDQYLAKTRPVSEAEEAIFVAFELLRLDLLNSNPFPMPPYSGAPMRGTESDKAHTLLVSRIACLGSFEHEQIGYTGPLSRNLLAYQQLAAAVRNSLRDLTESHICYMMLSGSAVRIRDTADYTDVAGRLPFGIEPDIGLALVVKSHLDELSSERRSDIKRWFNHAHNIDGDLEKAWKLWDAINAGIQAADSAIVSSETKTTFHNTDSWLREKREAPVMQNGT